MGRKHIRQKQQLLFFNTPIVMKKCILIYDDDVEILAVTKLILEQRQYKVETRYFCDDIIQDIETLQPHIVLMDLWIPKIGGVQAITLMKAHENTSAIPVIIFSANADIEALSKGIQATAFLKKPFAITELVDVIEKNMSK
jgi:DNA-binding response OmpR family regulator